MNFVVVGASAGLGRALCSTLAEQGHSLVLIAGDQRDLDAISADLRIRFNVDVSTVACHVSARQESVERIVEVCKERGGVDGLFFAAGASREDDDGTLSPPDIMELLETNMAGAMALTARFLPLMMQQRRGFIVGVGSVAAERGRSSNVVYAAAKRGLSSYFESLRHKAAAHGVKVQFYQMGYLQTGQTFGKRLLFPAARPDEAARHIVKNLHLDRGVIYYPAFWRWICLALRLTPWFIFKKLRF